MKRFEALFAPHMDAAYNLARWLTGNDAAARDVVQESALRAFRFLHRFADGNAKAWFLTIVRNESYTWLKASAGQHWLAIGDELAENDLALSHGQTPELLAIHAENAALLQQALSALPPAYREVIVLKELEDLPYKDIARVVDIPIGTVMSRLARARSMLKLELLKLHSHD
ncbi:sigma-70 family RNA polymerase sigma factor [Pseudomonas vancouverensis]|uniref:Sigma-70 family RNA polymerase sigma factor n=1 Tax=Pseudomonas vancouverensis TaxID=95300 RepID=A0A1H2MR22_PSEVA|nr:sigma-70 family RNA polymerase sigma factor [Pseudomonas vancouverensis]KAB0494524.1 sigma-70 family RNA polymerase sigma factor [Pseudomonas vancouverensis]TDB59190.1 sigma-70 family RNA polymerase sigma factor [Pseudomonas vancouverensis]SDU95697.1 RNA polymerase sigma-70 factor, ECF subfamily [Pseudomonas vancouverensis]